MNRLAYKDKKDSFSSPVRQDKSQENQKGGSYASPPPFSLTAQPVQVKAQKEVHQVPEPTGAAQEGPLAVKGKGDAQSMAANDINQGSIGDCFFLASLGAVAHSNPGALEKAITDKKDGTYSVTLYSKKRDDIGEARPDKGTSRFSKLTPKTITVAADFPTSVNGYDSANLNDLSATPPHAMGGDTDKKGQTELWVRIIEKAYAVLCGGYDKIGNGGFTENAMEALTGKQYTERAFRNGKRVKKRIIKASEKGEPCCVSTKSQEDIDGNSAEMVEFAENNDIVGGHAYTVLEANENTLKIRNPWGESAINATPELTWDQFKAFFDQYAAQN